MWSLSEVSLVKINVERAEEDVLLGVDPSHWAKIAQVGHLLCITRLEFNRQG
jgi:hypothetical protein